MAGATHFAANVEDEINRRLIHFRRGRGWRPRTIAYTGYGSPEFVRVLGRVVMSRHALPDADAQADTPVKSRRGWRPYVTAPVGKIPVTVTIDGVMHQTRADRGGYIELVVHDHGLTPGWHEVRLRARASAEVPARVLILGPQESVAMVSDIDDTVMVTSVPRPLIAVWNTFLRQSSARREVPGMSGLYRQIRERLGDIPVFYLSTGAWNAVPTITQFLHTQGYPAGPKLMTDWGPTNTGWFRSGREHKEQTLRQLHEEFPAVRWILIGDDGQHDPAIYRSFAQQHPEVVQAIAIRELTPTEQVLSHGTPVQLPAAERAPSPSAVPEVRGGDGAAIGARLLPLLD